MFSFFEKIPSISTQELQEKLTERPLVLDVREATEYQNGHISTAKNIPLRKVSTYKGNQTNELFIICQSGMRSKQAVKILRKKGFNAVNVRGGMNQWRGTVRGGKN